MREEQEEQLRQVREEVEILYERKVRFTFLRITAFNNKVGGVCVWGGGGE